MNTHTMLFQRLSLVFISWLISFTVYADSFIEKIRTLSEIDRIEVLSSNDKLEKIVCFINQQLDWKHAESGSFNQRIIVKHRGFDKPTVMVTEGYGASYALNPSYQEELSTLLDANLIFVEHRFFLESTPVPCNWDYMTVANSAGDYHHIRQSFGEIYTGKWFTTGISKGGQTTLFYRTYYPDDVDGSVAYVAPLNKSVEDGRHEPFLKHISDEKATKAVRNFQLEVLKRRDGILPLFEKYCREKDYCIQTSIDEVFDLCVLEYEFAFWQWGDDYQKIPGMDASNQELLNCLLKACEPSYFTPSVSGLPFNVQAMREIGYYGYDITPFKGLLTIKHSEGYLRRNMIPASLQYIEFDTNLYEKVTQFLAQEDVPMIFIYGENDPWTATGMTWLKDKKNMHVFVQPNGSHRARVATMPAETQKQIKKILADWLK